MEENVESRRRLALTGRFWPVASRRKIISTPRDAWPGSRDRSDKPRESMLMKVLVPVKRVIDYNVKVRV
ncbi:hypothetical protein, partial [Mesobacterium pallidum]|uniref:hypothetical protein n=1 Tax=Mesobacterium pallidum TaxID=2872037 RepID=UPI001EE30C02